MDTKIQMRSIYADEKSEEKKMFEIHAPQVSVIIPAYNVQRYLGRCIKSIVTQTMNNIEVIIVDDGSTDGSSEMCDEYAVKDTRIQVIHKANQGLSAARNDGIKATKAPYLMFVDGDDFVTPDFCDKPYKAAIENQADLVIFQSYSLKEGKEPQREFGTGMPVGIVDSETAIKYGRSLAWNKLYARSLFENTCYPEGRVFEDIATTHKLTLAAKRIVMLTDPLIYHVYRKDSISNSPTLSSMRDCFIANYERTEVLKSHGYSEELYRGPLCSSALAFMVRANPDNDCIYKRAEEVLGSIRAC